MKDKRSIIQIKLAALKRMTMWHFLNKPLNLVLVSEFPKSGGSWFGQMLSDALKLPFPRNKSPKLEKCIMHGHYLHHSNYNKVICVMRDGRDIMVSAYYHYLIENNRNPSFAVKAWRKKVPFENYDNIEENLPEFIEHMFTQYKVAGNVITWSDFVNSYIDNPKTIFVKYEDLLIDPVLQLQKAIKFLGEPEVPESDLNNIVLKYSFKTLSNREPGQEDNTKFLRKGISGDWKNNFSKRACEVFDKFGGEELIRIGYEQSRAWY